MNANLNQFSLKQKLKADLLYLGKFIGFLTQASWNVSLQHFDTVINRTQNKT